MAELKVTITGQDQLTPSIESAKKSLNDFSNSGAKSLSQISDRFEAIKSSSAPLKKQLRELKMMLADMQLSGNVNTSQYTQIAQYAGKIQDAMSDAGKAITRFADDTMGLKAATDAMQLTAAGATAVTGAMGLMGVKSDEVKNAILKVQSAMAILNAVQTISNKLNKDSALLQYVKGLRMKMTAAAAAKSAAATAADTAANTANAASAKAATVANTALAISMKALPWVAAASLAIAAGVAIYKYVSAQNSANKADEEARRQRQETIKTYDEIAKTAAQSAAKQVAAISMLADAWKRLSTTTDKQKWIKDNQKAFKELSLSIKSVSDAENVFVRQTPNIIQSMILRAQAAAIQSQIEKEAEKWLAQQLKKEKHRVFRAGQTINDTNGLVEGVDYTTNYQQVGGSVTGYVQSIGSPTLTEAGAAKMTERDIQRARQKESENATKAAQQFNQSVGNLGKLLHQILQQAHSLEAGVPQYTPQRVDTPTTKTSTKTTPTKTTKAESKKEEAAALSTDWYEAKIKEEKRLADATPDPAERERRLRNARAIATQRDVRFGGLFSAQSEFSDLQKKVEDAIKKVKIKDGVKIPVELDVENALANTEDAVGSVADAFNAMGDALERLGGEGAGSVAKLFGAIFDGAAKLLPQIQSLIAAHEAEALASGTASAAKLPFPTNLGAIATIVATIMGVIGTISSLKFASGGIVPGHSYSGDTVHAMLNSGEMVLNTRQQRNLFNLLNGGRGYGGGVAEVQLKVRGSDLYGALNNYTSIKSRTRR